MKVFSTLSDRSLIPRIAVLSVIAFVLLSAAAVSVTGLSFQGTLYSSAEFAAVVDTLSEHGGFFYTDNWVSNEMSYLEVIDDLDRYAVSGGVYIGVGPEQNYSYIHAVRPEVAFIVDIRRMNTIQHLLYKYLIEKNESRAGFFSNLLSRPLTDNSISGEKISSSDIELYFRSAQPDRKMMESTRTGFFEFAAPLKFSSEDSLAAEEVLENFMRYGIDITYRGAKVSWYPSLGDLITMYDSSGKYGSVFSTAEGYGYIRTMHLENRIIPVTGNFAGKKALRGLASLLRNSDWTVTAFYVSNVEQYLLRDYETWTGWVQNVNYLPVTDESVFIRWTHDHGWDNHQTRLQRVTKFLENAGKGLYYSYTDLKMFDYLK